jgi:hypothetical protein
VDSEQTLKLLLMGIISQYGEGQTIKVTAYTLERIPAVAHLEFGWNYTPDGDWLLTTRASDAKGNPVEIPNTNPQRRNDNGQLSIREENQTGSD